MNNKVLYKKVIFVNLLKFICIIGIVINEHNFFNLSIISNSQFIQYFRRTGFGTIEMLFLISGLLYCFTYDQYIKNKEYTFFSFIKHKYFKFFPFILITSTYIYIANLIRISFNISPFIFGSSDFIRFLINVVFASEVIFNNQIFNNAPLWYLSVLLMLYLISYFISKSKHGTFYAFFLVFIGIFMRYHNTLALPFFNQNFGRGIYSYFLGFLLGKTLMVTSNINDKKFIYLLK